MHAGVSMLSVCTGRIPVRAEVDYLRSVRKGCQVKRGEKSNFETARVQAVGHDVGVTRAKVVLDTRQSLLMAMADSDGYTALMSC